MSLPRAHPVCPAPQTNGRQMAAVVGIQCLPILEIWSGRRGSNPRPRPWQGRALPLSYTRIRDGGDRSPSTADLCQMRAANATVRTRSEAFPDNPISLTIGSNPSETTPKWNLSAFGPSPGTRNHLSARDRPVRGGWPSARPAVSERRPERTHPFIPTCSTVGIVGRERQSRNQLIFAAKPPSSERELGSGPC